MLDHEIDYRAIEERARHLRAEALASGMTTIGAFLKTAFSSLVLFRSVGSRPTT